MEGKLWVPMSSHSNIYDASHSNIYDAAYERNQLPVDISYAEIYEIRERMRYLYKYNAFFVEIRMATGSAVESYFDTYEDAERWAETILDDYYED